MENDNPLMSDDHGSDVEGSMEINAKDEEGVDSV